MKAIIFIRFGTNMIFRLKICKGVNSLKILNGDVKVIIVIVNYQKLNYTYYRIQDKTKMGFNTAVKK